MTAVMGIVPRHIQNFSEATAVTHHWGYADRMVPCTNDKGSCEYLDVVYGSHDVGMLYMGVMWSTFLGIGFLWTIYYWCKRQPSYETSTDLESDRQSGSTLSRCHTVVSTWSRQYLLQDCLRPVFGRTTRLQVLTLAVLTGYLAIFTFAGIVYKKWVTPVKGLTGVYNTRTSLGPWSNRVGVIAYALTPLSVLLSSRESLLSLITGLPYQSFNFLHRWLGYIILFQSGMHTIGWCIIEIKLYQPQPKVANAWIVQLYMIWGCIALLFILLLVILSLPFIIKRTGYEFFRKSHYILAMLYIGACVGHWKNLECFMIPGLVVWFVDRAVRLIRTGLMHYKYIDGNTAGFQSTEASLITFPDDINGDVVRMDLQHPHDPWSIGQHFYLTFPQSSLWQSHPFTPLNVPYIKAGQITHSYIWRAKKGETKKIADLAAHKSKTSVILNGPYGTSEVDELTPSTNILCVAGGTGITYVLPVLLSQITNCGCSSTRKMQLVWAIRKKADMSWIKPEMDQLYAAAKSIDLKISIFVTREDSKGSNSSIDKEPDIHMNEKSGSTSSVSSGDDTEIGGCCGSKTNQDLCTPAQPRKQSIIIERRGSIGTVPAELRHPNLGEILRSFTDSTVVGSTTVFASGPGGMISDLRTIVASCNDTRKVLRGDLRGFVDLKYDDRLEW